MNGNTIAVLASVAIMLLLFALSVAARPLPTSHGSFKLIIMKPAPASG